jgi:hypothetical protein
VNFFTGGTSTAFDASCALTSPPITFAYQFEPTAPLDYVRLVDEGHEHRRTAAGAVSCTERPRSTNRCD